MFRLRFAKSDFKNQIQIISVYQNEVLITNDILRACWHVIVRDILGHCTRNTNISRTVTFHAEESNSSPLSVWDSRTYANNFSKHLPA